MERKILWTVLVALLVADVVLLLQIRGLSDRYRHLRAEAAESRLEAAYGDEEQRLLTATTDVPATFPRLDDAGEGDRGVHFFLLVSVDDCTNCIEDEIAQLNRLHLAGPDRLAGSWIYFVDDERPEAVDAVVRHLSPAPRVPLAVDDLLPMLPQASTPLVLVVRNADRRILDAHKPIPQDLTRRDAFYARWRALLTEGDA